MAVELNYVIDLLEDLAPQDLAAEWDNVGLQVGSYHQEVNSILVTLDVDSRVLQEAITNGVDLIVSHHPFIFSELDSIELDTTHGQIIKQAIENEIAIYAMHTNYDVAPGGLNDLLADELELESPKVLQVTERQQLKKIVVFVPKEAAAEVRSALGAAGAGWLGNYSHCTFRQQGIGTFKPLAGTEPYQGVQGEVNEVAEERIETIVPAGRINSVLEAVFRVHPYEEVAYDIYPLDNDGEARGLGRIGQIDQMSLKGYTELVKEKLGLANVKVVGQLDRTLNRVALCSGSGADFITLARNQGADVLVTGDVKFHEAQLAEDQGLAVIDAGHYGTEKIMQRGVVNYLQAVITEEELGIKILNSQINTKPWQLI